MSERPASCPLVLEGVSRAYRSGEADLHVLRDASLTLHAGEIVALVAPSGTGKSTLLHLAGLLERPDSGVVRVDGADSGSLNDTARTAIRRDRIGFVYQAHHLLAEFTAIENVTLPQLIGHRPNARDRATALLTAFGLAHRLHHLPGKLSGGEKQRVAIARALANAPGVLLADEPTGNLDVTTGRAVMDLLFGLQATLGTTLLLITHDPALAERCGRQVRVADGLIV